MTNRQRLERALDDIESVKENNVISPTPYSFLTDAEASIRGALRFVLDEREQDRVPGWGAVTT